MESYVESKYLDLLPLQIRSMVAQIEGAIKAPIAVRQRMLGDLSVEGLEHLPTLDCYMNMGKMFVTIILTDASIESHTLAHEIIHAWRYIVRLEPRLQVGGGAENTNFAQMLENDIEHIFVIPEEMTYFPESFQYWENLYSNLIEPIAGAVQFLQRLGRPSTHFKQDLLRHWLILSAIPKLECRTRLESALAQAGYLDEANALFESTMAAHPDKGRMLGIALRQLGLPTHSYELSRYDVQNRNCPTQAVPSD